MAPPRTYRSGDLAPPGSLAVRSKLDRQDCFRFAKRYGILFKSCALLFLSRFETRPDWLVRACARKLAQRVASSIPRSRAWFLI